jgi:Copper amine oxidase, enzyme domain
MANFGDFHFVSGASWSVFWRISQLNGSGLEIWFADFQGRRVMWRGSQPFAIVPYHRPIAAGAPSPPHYTFKDGISPQWGGAEFTSLKRSAPNTWASLAHNAAVDTEAVEVHVDPSGHFGPAHLTITAKFQCGWYQYVHSWEFDGDGNIHARVAMGGQLNPNDPSKAHLHHMYFRVDLDIDGFSRDLFEQFEHNSFNDPGGDGWVTIGTQGKRLHAPNRARKWRIRDSASTSELGAFRGYEIEIPQLAGRDNYSTGDIWATVYRGDSVQQGGEVGVSAPTDEVLETNYCQGPLDKVNGNDVVFWVAIHAHHDPRYLAEEAIFLPYHYAEFSITPRGFEVFERQNQG